MKYRYALIGMLLFFWGCSTSVTDYEPEVIPAYAHVIHDVEFGNNTITISVFSGAPDPCYNSVSPKITMNENDYQIQLYQKSTGQPCIQILGSILHEITLPASSGYAYTYRFNRFNEAPLDTTIIIP